MISLADIDEDMIDGFDEILYKEGNSQITMLVSTRSGEVSFHGTIKVGNYLVTETCDSLFRISKWLSNHSYAYGEHGCQDAYDNIRNFQYEMQTAGCSSIGGQYYTRGE